MKFFFNNTISQIDFQQNLLNLLIKFAQCKLNSYNKIIINTHKLIFFLTNILRKMNIQKKFTHNTIKNQYQIWLQARQSLKIKLQQKYSTCYWQGQFTFQTIKDITFKTGNELYFQQFVNILIKAIQQKDIACYIDILTSQDLQNLKAKRTNQPSSTNSENKNKSKSNKRYLILTYMTNDTKYHYPLSLPAKQKQNDIQNLKLIYNQLRVQLQNVRTSALNQTQNKTSNSFSIQYEKKNNKNSQQSSKMKEVDQVRSQNQMLKAKLARLQEQVQKKKANIQIQAAIQRTKQLKQKLQTQNLQLVDWKNNIADQQSKQTQLKKQMEELHRKICKLLTSEKQVAAKKKGQQTEKQLAQVKNAIKKYNAEIEKLKKELEASKLRVKQLQQKAKKLTSQKNVIQKGSRRGPYSSAGSVRSFGSYNSYGSKRSTNSNNTSVSKPRSNYSYNSNRFR